MTKKHKVGGEKWKYTILMFLNYIYNGIISLGGNLQYIKDIHYKH